jgi:hypothetical protein
LDDILSTHCALTYLQVPKPRNTNMFQMRHSLDRLYFKGAQPTVSKSH